MALHLSLPTKTKLHHILPTYKGITKPCNHNKPEVSHFYTAI